MSPGDATRLKNIAFRMKKTNATLLIVYMSPLPNAWATDSLSA